MIVVDASAVLEVLLNTPAGGPVARRLFRQGETLHAPHVIDLEIAQVLRRYARAREIDPGRGRQAIADLADFSITRYPHDLFLPRIWELRNSMTAYDAAYIALAEALEAPLITLDRRLARAGGHAAIVEVP